jgi:MFS family permease
MIVITAYWQIGYGIINFLSPVLIVNFFKAGERGLGLRYSIAGVGCVIGILGIRYFLSKVLSKEDYVDYMLIYGSILSGGSIIFMFMQKNFIFFLIFLLINAIIINPMEIITESYLLNKSKDYVRGRISSLYHLGMSLCMILGVITGMLLSNLGQLLGIISGIILISSSTIVLIINYLTSNAVKGSLEKI